MSIELAGSDLRRAVFATIQRELGSEALVRFIAENLSGKGDYTRDRQEAKQPSVDEIVADLKAKGRQL